MALRLRLWLSLAALLIFFAPILKENALATSPSTPTVDDARKAIEDNIHAQFKGGLKVIDVNKTDAQLSQFAGISSYTLEFRVLAEATQNLCHVQLWHTWDVYGSQFCPQYADIRHDNAPPSIWAGEYYDIAGEAHFTMKESGWVLTGVSTQGISPSNVSAPGSAPERSAPGSAQAKHDIESIPTYSGAPGRGCICSSKGGLRVISLEKTDGMPRTGDGGHVSYDFQFRAIVEGVKDDFHIDAGQVLFTNQSCPPHLCGSECARSPRDPDCAARQAGANLFSNFRAPPQGPERSSRIVAPPSIRVGQTYALEGTLNYIAAEVGWLAVSYRVEVPKLVTTRSEMPVDKVNTYSCTNIILHLVNPLGDKMITDVTVNTDQMLDDNDKPVKGVMRIEPKISDITNSPNTTVILAYTDPPAGPRGVIMDKDKVIKREFNPKELAPLQIIKQLTGDFDERIIYERAQCTKIPYVLKAFFEMPPRTSVPPAGPVVSGMTMEQVLLVRGAPTHKEVIPPDMELWHYPASEVAFQNGKVSYVKLQ